MKTHTRGLYRKLGATSREEAVERAAALGLLDGTDGADADPDGSPRRADLRRARGGNPARIPSTESGLGERLRLDRVELLLRDRTAVEQRLRPLDLGSGASARGDGLDVAVELRLGLLRLL